jgi:hypothetical protein
MRPVLLILGIAATLMGLLWMAQGAGLVQWPRSSFMLDQRPWITRGAILAAIGLAVIAISARRK